MLPFPMVSSLTSPPPFCSPRSYSFRVLPVCLVGSPSCLPLLHFCKNSERINPVLSYSCALFRNESFANSSEINDFLTLLQITGGVHPRTEILSRFLQPPTPNSFGIRTSAKPARNPFGVRTSKTQHLKPFRINTYKTTGGAGLLCFGGHGRGGVNPPSRPARCRLPFRCILRAAQ